MQVLCGIEASEGAECAWRVRLCVKARPHGWGTRMRRRYGARAHAHATSVGGGASPFRGGNGSRHAFAIKHRHADVDARLSHAAMPSHKEAQPSA